MMRLLLDPGLAALLRGLKSMLEDGFVVLEASSQPWASVTFEGARHALWLRLADPSAAVRVAALLPELDFRLRGHLVAEVAEVEVRDEELRFTALTVVDL